MTYKHILVVGLMAGSIGMTAWVVATRPSHDEVQAMIKAAGSAEVAKQAGHVAAGDSERVDHGTGLSPIPQTLPPGVRRRLLLERMVLLKCDAYGRTSVECLDQKQIAAAYAENGR